jgi:adenylate cyclase
MDKSPKPDQQAKDVTEERVEQRLAAILAADAAGYSRLMASDERATVAALDSARAVFRKHTGLHDGRVVDTAGDSVLAIFGTAAGAVNAAMQVQNEISARSSQMPESSRMLFRIGVHLGDVMVKADGSVYGDGVNIAARLQSLAQPGGINVSDAVRGAVRSKVTATFLDLGEQSVKNILEPVRAYQVDGEGLRRRESQPVASDALSLPDRPSIAVLPFANMSGDPEQVYFTDGITEDIITELSRFKSLFVIARNSTFTYKGKAVDVRVVAKELGVRYVLEGSIRRAGQRVRITAQLIDAHSGGHLWAERYDRAVEDIFAVQEEVTQAIVTAIAPHIELAEIERTRRPRPGNVSAYELGMRAWSATQLGFRDGDEAAGHEAIRLAHEAIAIDATCSLAWRALAAAAWQGAVNGTGGSKSQVCSEGIAAARRAIAIDSDEIALAYKGLLLFYDGQGESGLRDLRRAGELNPNSSLVLAALVYAEAARGDPALAVQYAPRAMRLSPRDPLQYVVKNNLAWAYFAVADYQNATEAAGASVSEAPEYRPARACLVVSLVGLGKIDQAQAEYHKLFAMAPDLVRRLMDANHSDSPNFRERRVKFFRIAAGLEDPSAAASPGVGGSQASA